MNTEYPQRLGGRCRHRSAGPEWLAPRRGGVEGRAGVRRCPHRLTRARSAARGRAPLRQPHRQGHAGRRPAGRQMAGATRPVCPTYACRVLWRRPQRPHAVRTAGQRRWADLAHALHNLVHNAASGYWSIATGATPAAQVLGAYDASFGAGLLEAMVQAHTAQAPILLVAYDSEYPPPLHAKRPIADTSALALVLSPTRGPHALAELRMPRRGALRDGDLNCAGGGLERRQPDGGRHRWHAALLGLPRWRDAAPGRPSG